tara:strand:- start:555 stop:764 length:210 start_codon:yes stop_codon:yes gene_type:complete
MKAVLEFNYPQDTDKCRRAIHADEAFKALLKIDDWLDKKFTNKADLEDALKYVREITSHTLSNTGEQNT